MLMQPSPNTWSCLATSFAIVLDVSLSDLIAELGHDGSEIVFPEFGDPYCRRAFHYQEFLEPCLLRGLACVSVEAVPILCTSLPVAHMYYPITFPKGNGPRLVYYMSHYKGVMVGENAQGNPHAVAWDGDKCYDSNGCRIHPETEFSMREFLALIPIKAKQ